MESYVKRSRHALSLSFGTLSPIQLMSTTGCRTSAVFIQRATLSSTTSTLVEISRWRRSFTRFCTQLKSCHMVFKVTNLSVLPRGTQALTETMTLLILLGSTNYLRRLPGWVLLKIEPCPRPPSRWKRARPDSSSATVTLASKRSLVLIHRTRSLQQQVPLACRLLRSTPRRSNNRIRRSWSPAMTS